jgi:hypothetical protein
MSGEKITQIIAELGAVPTVRDIAAVSFEPPVQPLP